MDNPCCRLLPYHVADGAWNMAADEVLLADAVAGIASFRLYGWDRPTLSLGYFQSAAVARADLRLAALPWVRRPSGGSALVHHHELTYALALPAGSPWQKRRLSWMHRLHAIIARALHRQGVEVQSSADEHRQGPVLCFLHHTPGDLICKGSKIGGSAQRKQRGALLQHGGILLAQSELTPELPGIAELAGISLGTAWQAELLEVLREDTGWQLQPISWMPAQRERIEALCQNRYRSPAWNEKR